MDLISRCLKEENHNQDGITKLHLAIISGNLNETIKLISEGADVNTTDKSGIPAFFYSVIYKKLNILEYFFNQEKIDIFIRDSRNKNIIDYAMKHVENDFSLLFCKSKLDINLKNKFGDSLIHILAKENHAEQILYIINALKANYKICNSKGYLPIHLASKSLNIEACKALNISKGDISVLTSNNENCLQLICFNNDNNKDNEKLIFAKYLISEGLSANNLDNLGMTALHYQAINGADDKLTKYLAETAEHKVYNKFGLLPIHLAIINNNFLNMKCLVECSEDNLTLFSNNAQKYNLAMYLTAKNNLHALEYFYNLNSNIINITSAKQQNALMVAAANGFTEIAKMLLKANININLQDYVGKTAMFYSCQFGHEEVASVLLKTGRLDFSLKDKAGLKIWHWILDINKPNLLDELFKVFPEGINDKDNFGQTPLIWAAKQNQTKQILKLLDLGADTKLCDNNGFNAFENSIINGKDLASLAFLKAVSDNSIVINQNSERLEKLLASSQYFSNERKELILTIIKLVYNNDLDRTECDQKFAELDHEHQHFNVHVQMLGDEIKKCNLG